MTWLDLRKMDADTTQQSKMTSSSGTRPMVKYCPLCQAKGKSYKLQLFQINLQEALMLCPATDCTFPMGVQPSQDILVQRNASQATFGRKKKAQNPSVGKSANSHLPATKTSKQQTNSASSSVMDIKVNLQISQKKQKFQSFSGYGKPLETECKVSNNTAVASENKLGHVHSNEQSMQKGVPFTSTNNNSRNNIEKTLVENDGLNCGLNYELSNGVDRNLLEVLVDSNSNNSCSSKLSCPENVRLDCSLLSETESEVHTIYPQWRNKDNLCWLDVLLCLMVHNHTFKQYFASNKVSHSVVQCLIKSYREAQKLYNKTPSKSLNPQNLRINTSSGNSPEKDQSCLAKLFRPDAKILCEADRFLLEARSKVWHHLQPKMKCQPGRDDSTTCGIMAILKSEPCVVQDLCSIKYMLHRSCNRCGRKATDSLEKRVLVFSEVQNDFDMLNPRFLNTCDMCQVKGQVVNVQLERYPAVIFVHFVHGLPGSSITKFDFVSPEGQTYAVSGVVQYKRKPDHFVAWVRNLKSFGLHI